MKWRDLLSRCKRKPEVAAVIAATTLAAVLLLAPKVLGPDTVEAGDGMVIEELRRLGADLSQPREIRHYLYVPTREASKRAADELVLQGFKIEERQSADAAQNPPNPWLVLATTHVVVDAESIADSRRRFQGLAAVLRGEYDGWEAAPKP